MDECVAYLPTVHDSIHVHTSTIYLHGVSGTLGTPLATHGVSGATTPVPPLDLLQRPVMIGHGRTLIPVTPRMDASDPNISKPPENT